MIFKKHDKEFPGFSVNLSRLGPVFREIKSSEISELTSAPHQAVKDTIEAAYKEKNTILGEIKEAERYIEAVMAKLRLRQLLPGIFTRRLKASAESLGSHLEYLKKRAEETRVNIDIEFHDDTKDAYSEMVESFTALSLAGKIWDITAINKESRHSQTESITRIPTQFYVANIDVIKSQHPALHMVNKNGGDILIYPTFVIMLGSHGKIAVIDIIELEIKYSHVKFVEHEEIHNDTHVSDYTFEHTNLDGSADRRHNPNRRIPIVDYGRLTITSSTGVQEEYLISSYTKTRAFWFAYHRFQNMV